MRNADAPVHLIPRLLLSVVIAGERERRFSQRFAPVPQHCAPSPAESVWVDVVFTAAVTAGALLV